MEYIDAISWLLLWPIVIYLSYKFSMRNILNLEEKEK